MQDDTESRSSDVGLERGSIAESLLIEFKELFIDRFDKAYLPANGIVFSLGVESSEIVYEVAYLDSSCDLFDTESYETESSFNASPIS